MLCLLSDYLALRAFFPPDSYIGMFLGPAIGLPACLPACPPVCRPTDFKGNKKEALRHEPMETNKNN